MFTSSTSNYNPNKSYELPNLPSDSISCISWSPPNTNPLLLAATSWDGTLRLWEIQSQKASFASRGGSVNGVFKTGFENPNRVPLLCCALGRDGIVFTGGCDRTVKAHNPQTNQQQTIGQHDSPVAKVFFDNDLVISGGWDKVIKFWDMRQSNPAFTLPLRSKIWAMDVRWPVVVHTAEKQILVYDMLRTTPGPAKTLKSLLNLQPRCIRLFPDRKGCGMTSIEGRVAIQAIEEGDTFGFKAHRTEVNPKSSKAFPINTVDFHTPIQTLATGGSDGQIVFWDKDNKQRLKSMEKLQAPIIDARYDPSGTLLAYAVSYDWYKGYAGYQPNSNLVKLFVHILDDEMKLPYRR